MHPGGTDARRKPGRWGNDGWSARVALSLGVFGILAVPGTHASWTESAQVSGTTFQTGTVDLRVQDSDLITTYTAMNISTLEPGDSTAGILTVRNAGTAPVRYYVDASASDTDGKGLGSALVAKVTTDTVTSGVAPSVTCAGSALAGSGTTFSADLVGSAASPRLLAGGASETLCVQARLPNGASALGAATSIGFTFSASTGLATTPGWTDSVAVSGTTLGTINAFYLGTNSTGDTTSTTLLPLRRPGPTLTTLHNYDTDRDSNPGLLLKSGGPQVGRTQQWFFPVGDTPMTLNGTADLRIWSAVTGFSTTLDGSLDVTLYDCDANGGGCTQLVTTRSSSTGSWSGGSDTWVSKTLPITTTASSYTWAAGRSLGVAVSNSGANDMMLAYDTTSYRSSVIIK